MMKEKSPKNSTENITTGVSSMTKNFWTSKEVHEHLIYNCQQQTFSKVSIFFIFLFLNISMLIYKI